MSSDTRGPCAGELCQSGPQAANLGTSGSDGGNVRASRAAV